MQAIRYFFFIISLLLVTSLPANAHAALHILATIKPIHALVSAVTEGVQEPELLLDKNASPHSYTLRPNDIIKLQHADIIFRVGHDFEIFLEKPLENSPADVVELANTDGLKTWPLRKNHIWEDGDEDEHTGTNDPHIWLDPGNAVLIVNKIAAIMCLKDPEHKARYMQNAQHMINQIAQLDKELAANLAPYQHTPYLVSHDAYQYFEKHYHLNGVGAITLTPDQTPGAKTIMALQETAEKRGAVCLFSEPSFPDNFIRLIAEKTAIGTGILDAEWGALPSDSGKSAYFSLMRGLSRTMIDCFNSKKLHSLLFEKLYSPSKDQIGFDAITTADKQLFLFWRTDCVPCMQEITLLPALARAHPSLAIVLLSLQDKAVAEAHLPKDLPANITLLAIAHGEKDTGYLRAFGNHLLALPYSAMMTKDKVCASHYGILGSDLLNIWEKTC